MNKDNLNKAFTELRKHGYFAEQNFMCCQTCGWDEVPENKSDKVVFYHQQDAEDLYKRGNCCLAWSGDGNEIVKILNSNGIKTEWDGTNDQRITINIRG